MRFLWTQHKDTRCAIGLSSPITHAYTDIIPGHALEVLLVHLLEGRAGGGGGAAAARRQVSGAGVAAAVLAALLLHDGCRHAHHAHHAGH